MPYGITAHVRLCSSCDGFPVVAITTGARRRDGSRITLHVTCPACRGTGTRPAPAALAQARW
ncbi:hypothetical protein SMD44_01201 [Streptomyces alboflavus]|uniref:Uncharacterized protein n=1 Tax=Streptomyces alboflavus TaxID=67267 RepID=A0A1Z1W5S6_9ACTN|nr:hypothetical protein [Streptomyces alboflavus]ARX81803.1 hypothetical protein SMD44_01201 [Streptomyces alboflavus]